MTNYIDCSNKNTRKRIFEIIGKLHQGVKLADDMGISNLLYNEAYIDLLIAAHLGHKYNIETQGADALDRKNNFVEYKCIVKKGGKYSGSFQFHWLSTEKITKYRECKYFYFAWRDELKIEKIIQVEAKILLPEIERKAGKAGSTAGHKSFSCGQIEKLVEEKKATVVFGKKIKQYEVRIK